MNFGTCNFQSLHIEDEVSLNLLNQIDEMLKIDARDENESLKIKRLVVKMYDRIASIEQHYKGKIKEMVRAQNSSFADLLIDKREEIEKLRLEAKELKSNLKEATKHNEMFKEEVLHLNSALRRKNDEINHLTYELIEAETYIESIESKKTFSNHAISSAEDIKHHFKIIRMALLTGENMRRILQAKKTSID